MQFEHAPDVPYDDVGGGRVLHSAPGFPGFPVRLAIEVFERARMLTGRGSVGLWDPMCGAGGLATSLALLRRQELTRVLATDVDAAALELAKKNLALTTSAGLAARREQLVKRAVAEDRIDAVDRLSALVAVSPLPTAVHRADVTDVAALRALDLDGIDVVFTDLPYGRQTDWTSTAAAPVAAALEALRAMLTPGSIVVFSTTEREQFRPLPAATRSFKHGHRHIRMYRVG